MGDDGLLLGQLQASGFQKFAEYLLGLLRDLLCSRRDDKVIGIPHQIDLVGVLEDYAFSGNGRFATSG